eukprot:9028365-Alexandrium_andersonii.AAC.1
MPTPRSLAHARANAPKCPRAYTGTVHCKAAVLVRYACLLGRRRQLLYARPSCDVYTRTRASI